jgi:hypothetical protein
MHLEQILRVRVRVEGYLVHQLPTLLLLYTLSNLWGGGVGACISGLLHAQHRE